MALWLVISLAGFIAISCAVGVVVAAVLGSIGSQVSDLLERELWGSAPLTPRSR